MANTTSNRAIKIEDLQEKFNIGESNLLIVEDDLDTKKSTVRELKKSFSGDYLDPSRYYYYSSQYIHDLIQTIEIAISNRAPKSAIESLQQQLKDVVKGDWAAPDISEKLEYERNLSDAYYVHKALKTVTGSSINIDGHKGLVTVTPKKPDNSLMSNATGKILYYSKNRLNLPKVQELNDNSAIKINDNYGFRYTQNNSVFSIDLPVGYENNTIHCPAGTYYLNASVKFSNAFKDKSIRLDIHYTTGVERYPISYTFADKFKFEATNPFDKITLVFDSDNSVTNSYVEFSNIMISQYDLSEYVEYDHNEKQVDESGTGTYEIYNNDYVFEFTIPNTILEISYYDHTITLNTLLEKIDTLNDSINDKIDRCGLMTDYGTYHPFDSCAVISSDNSGEVSDADKLYDRNGFTSKKLKIKNDIEDFEVKQILTDIPDQIESVSLCFYIDKLVIERLTAEGGITLILCSDSPEYDNINHYQVTIRRSEMVHGWNVIKKHISEFATMLNPDIYSIKSATVSVLKNENLIGQELYINSISFNQKMKPTVILSFDGTYKDSNTTTYPYLEARNIPASVLLNSSREIDASEFNELIRLMIINGWDIGAYGNIANKQYAKEILQQDDNYRNQYIGLRMNKEYLQENAIYNPISYSAPYGNLRPITVPFLKELGYKIARTESDSFVSIFTNKDFAIPMTLISNLLTEDEIKNKIDYAISNNVALSLFVRDVTEYGDDLVAKKATFESIIDYIHEKEKEGKLQVLTMADFYHKCVE